MTQREHKVNKNKEGIDIDNERERGVGGIKEGRRELIARREYGRYRGGE